jgi:hypothetical protein
MHDSNTRTPTLTPHRIASDVTTRTMTITEAKMFVRDNGGKGAHETLTEAVTRIQNTPPGEICEPYEASRMRSVFAGSFDCHVCSCHIAPPCNACVTCTVCEQREAV